MTINKRLLRRVRDYILAEPRRLNMDFMGVSVDPKEDEKINPPCGTVGCIAGWSCILGSKEVLTTPEGRETRMQWDRGQNLLGLSKEESYRLFNEPWRAFSSIQSNPTWPRKFARRYLKAKTPRGRASVTAARIDHFIATNGAE